jgi:hypothetical protein
MFDRFVPNPIKWSARERWKLRLVSFGIGLLWGVAAFVFAFAIQAEDSRGSFWLFAAPQVLGAVLGVGQASQIWLAGLEKRIESRLNEIIVYAAVGCVLSGFWATVGLVLLLYSPFGLFASPALFLFYIVPSVFMAPLAVFVWKKTLEHLAAQRRAFEEGE